MRIRIGTRASELALKQVDIVTRRILDDYPDTQFEIVKIRTMGDKVTDRPIAEAGGKGAFISEIERALTDGDIDMAVHSGKDVPSVVEDTFSLNVITPRENPADVMIVRRERYEEIAAACGIPESEENVIEVLSSVSGGACIGTSGPRRQELIGRMIPDSRIKLLRGNVPTRLDKLRADEYDGIILAAAGLIRLYGSLEAKELTDLVIQPLDVKRMVPSGGQGIIVCETLAGSEISSLIKTLEDERAKEDFDIEKGYLTEINADCRDPVGAYTYIEDGVRKLITFFSDSKIDIKEISDRYIDKCDSDITTPDKHKNMVYIAGAGIGDISYLTLKTYKLLCSADVILYDALTDKYILKYAKKSAKLIGVGKRAGHHSMPQDDICRLIISEYRELSDTVSSGGIILRLKGGDPFVFGRGVEECVALDREGIPYEVVPGVSSAIAVPELVGIPVTYRATDDTPVGARGFMVVTAHTATGEEIDYKVLSSFDGTIVFLMGISRIESIVEGLINNGKSGDTPAAIVCNGSLRDEYVLRAKLSEIGTRARDDERIAPPGVLIVGSAAALDIRSSHHKKDDVNRHYDSIYQGGKRVLITGTYDFATRLRNELYKHGIEADICPHIRIRRRINADTEHIFHEDIKTKILLFTGRNSADIFFDIYKEKGKDIRDLSDMVFASIGMSTADYIYDTYGIKSDIIPDKYTSEDLADKLIYVIKNVYDISSTKVYTFRAAVGSDVLRDKLHDEGIAVDETVLYDTVCDSAEIDKIRGIGYDYITFASAEGVRAFVSGGGILENTTAVGIGKATEAVLKAHTDSYVTAKSSTVSGLAEVVRGLIYTQL